MPAYSTRDDLKAFLLLTLACAVVWYGCARSAPESGATEQQSEFTAQVYAALYAIERHGLPEWADWGREHIGLVAEDMNGLIPKGYLGYTWAFDDEGTGERSYVILLGEKWLALTVDEQGLVLLHELWHVRTGDLGHPEALWELLRLYEVGG